MQKTTKKWAVHKSGTNQFGYMCSFREEAEQMLEDMKKDILNMPKSEIDRYHVVEVDLVWNEQL